MASSSRCRPAQCGPLPQPSALGSRNRGEPPLQPSAKCYFKLCNASCIVVTKLRCISAVFTFAQIDVEEVNTRPGRCGRASGRTRSRGGRVWLRSGSELGYR